MNDFCCHHPDRPAVHSVYCEHAFHGVTPTGKRGVYFLRAPMQDSPADVEAWLRARGCVDIETHVGPDGSWRGSGRLVEMGDGETARVASEAGL